MSHIRESPSASHIWGLVLEAGESVHNPSIKDQKMKKGLLVRCPHKQVTSVFSKLDIWIDY